MNPLMMEIIGSRSRIAQRKEEQPLFYELSRISSLDFMKGLVPSCLVESLVCGSTMKKSSVRVLLKRMRRRMISLMRRSIWRFRNLNLEECKKDAMFYDSEGGGNCPDREERISSVEFVRELSSFPRCHPSICRKCGVDCELHSE